jgi:hypothetical protein
MSNSPVSLVLAGLLRFGVVDSKAKQLWKSAGPKTCSRAKAHCPQPSFIGRSDPFSALPDAPDGFLVGALWFSSLIGDGLIEEGFDIQRYSDQVWGEGECDWEKEIACWGDITSLDDVLLEIQKIPHDPDWRPQAAALAFSAHIRSLDASASS